MKHSQLTLGQLTLSQLHLSFGTEVGQALEVCLLTVIGRDGNEYEAFIELQISIIVEGETALENSLDRVAVSFA